MPPTSRQQVVSRIERLGVCATVRTADRESAAQAAEGKGISTEARSAGDQADD